MKRLPGYRAASQPAHRCQPFISQPLPFSVGLGLSRRREIGAHGFKGSSGLLLGSNSSGVGMKHGFHLAGKWIEVNDRFLMEPERRSQDLRTLVPSAPENRG